jgi:hypothetical protein
VVQRRHYIIVRWQSRKHTVRSSHLGGPDDIHWRADLVESVRIDGKPRQKYVAYLVGFTEQQTRDKRTGKIREAQQFFIWERALERLDQLDQQFFFVLHLNARKRIEDALAKRIGMPAPTREELAAFHVKNSAELDELVAAMRTAR